MLNPARLLRKMSLFALLISVAAGATAENWQQIHDELQAKIKKEYSEPIERGYFDSVSKDLSKYLYWLEVKAGDRDRAQSLAASASNQGNPHWENRFLDLMDEAHDSGDNTLWTAVEIFLRIRGKRSGHAGDQWSNAVFKSNYFGKPLFTKAKELHYDHEYVRQAVRCLVLFALGDVETGPLGLYDDRLLRHGTQFDDEGNLLMPDMDFDVTCLPRSAFHMESEGTVKTPADYGLGWVERIREVCEWYQFWVDYQDATDLMNQFLKDALCHYMTRHRGHKWHLDLANQYELDEARTHIEGFYATLFGTVFLDTGHELKPAPNATVMVMDPSQTWETMADGEGDYEIGDALLHDKCSPFDIFGSHRGDEVADQYEGPLHEPDPSARHGKDLVIERSERAVWVGSLTAVSSHRFECGASIEKEQETSYLTQNDENKRVVTLHLQTDPFEIEEAPIVVLSGRNLSISGNVVWWVNNFRSTLHESAFDFCDDERVTPGDWVREVETVFGQRQCAITDGVAVTIRKAQTQSANRMRELMEEMSEHADDPKRLAELRAELEEAMNPATDKSSIPVRIRLQIALNCEVTARFKQTRKQFERCERTTDFSSAGHEVTPPGGAIALDFDGVYKRNTDGSATITASHFDTRPGSNIASGWDCPPESLVERCNLVLKRIPLKD